MALTETSFEPGRNARMLIDRGIRGALDKAVSRATLPVVATESLIERADNSKDRTDSQKYHSILSEAFRKTRVPLTDGTRIIIADTLPASPHTRLKIPKADFVSAVSNQEESYVDTITDTYGDHLPAHTLTWAIREIPDESTEDGVRYEAASFFDLATLSDADRFIATKHFARSMAREARLVHTIVDSHTIGVNVDIFSSAATGFHTMEDRLVDGGSRGSASNKTAHAHATAIPRIEEDVEGELHEDRPLEAVKVDLLLKDADPFSRLFAEVAKYPMNEQLGRIFAQGTVTPIDADSLPGMYSKLPFGWKVSLEDKISLAEGLNTTLTFLNEMQVVWNEGRKIIDGTADRLSIEEVERYIGSTGVAILESLKPTKHKSEKTKAEAARKLALIESRQNKLRPNDLKMHMYYELLKQPYLEVPRFTLPGQPSFNFFFEYADTNGDGSLKAIYIVPALSEKSVAENESGTAMERAENRG